MKTQNNYGNSVFKMKIENSIFNFQFLEAEIFFLSNLVLNKIFEIQFTVYLKNKFPT